MNTWKSEGGNRSMLGLLRVPSCAWRLLGVFGLMSLSLTFASCTTQKESEPSATAAPTPSGASSPAPPTPSVEAPKINAARAMQYTKEVVAFGARPIGSANHKKLEAYILGHLNSDEVTDDSFTADTVEGKFPIRNIIAKYPGTKNGIIVIAGHYDT